MLTKRLISPFFLLREALTRGPKVLLVTTNQPQHRQAFQIV